jgi:hypothetical protein
MAALFSSASSYSNNVRMGGHMHTLFAFSAPLSSAVDFLFAKLEEFLRGFTGVFVHRLLLFILSRAYSRPGAGPSPGDPREVLSPEARAAREQRERSLQDALEHAREQWRTARAQELRGMPLPNQPPSTRDTETQARRAQRELQRAQREQKREQRRAELAARQARAAQAVRPHSVTAVTEGERKENDELLRRSPSESQMAARRASPSSGFMASVFGGSPAAAAAAAASAPTTSQRTHSRSSASSSPFPEEHPRAPPASLSREGSSSSAAGASASAAAAAPAGPAAAAAAVQWDDPSMDATERRFLDADAMLLSGITSNKRPRTSGAVHRLR